MPLSPFHLAIPVRDIAEARHFYRDQLGFTEGRSSEHWIDYNFFGHQLVVHLDPNLAKDDTTQQAHNPVDGHQVPVPHFGVVLEYQQWCDFKQKVSAVIDQFVVEPHIRFAGEPGEQGTMFFTDPSGNALEFKTFKDIEGQLFAT